MAAPSVRRPRQKPKKRIIPPPAGNLTNPLSTQQSLLVELTIAGLSAGYVSLDAVKRAAGTIEVLRGAARERAWGPYEQVLARRVAEGAVKAPGRDSGVTVGGRVLASCLAIGEQLRAWREKEKK